MIRFFITVFFFGVVFFTDDFGTAATTVDNQSDVKRICVARLQRLQNISLIYTLHRKAEPVNIDPALLAAINQDLGIDLRNADKTDTWTKRFYFCQGNLRYEYELSAQDVQQNRDSRVRMPIRFIAVYNSERTETLQWMDGSAELRGSIRSPLPPPDQASVVDLGLGLRLLFSEHWLTPQQIEQASITDIGDGKHALSFSDAEGRKHEWQIDAGLGYALSYYEVVETPHRLIAIECTNFDLINGIMVPMKVTMQHINVDAGGQRRVRETYTAEISSFIVDDPNNGIDRFRIVFPRGTSVMDYRIQRQFQIVTKDTPLDDATIAKILQRSREENQALIDRAQRKIDEVLSRPPTKSAEKEP